MVEKITSDIKLGNEVYDGVWKVLLDTADGGTVELCHYEEAFAEGKEEGLTEGYDQGFEEGLADGREEGIQTEYDRFWDGYQQSGGRSDYEYGFAGTGWSAAGLMPPKYPISSSTVKSCIGMFWQFNKSLNWQSEPYDMTEVSKKLDLSASLNLRYAFDSAYCKNLTVDVSGATNMDYAFSQLNGIGVRSLWVKIGEVASLESTFVYNSSLRELTLLEGSVIATNINLGWSTGLSIASLKSVIGALKNYSGTIDAGKYKVTFTEGLWTVLEADSTAPDGNTWRDYVETTLGWLT